RKGILTYCDPRRIFGEQGHQRLREYAQQAGIYYPRHSSEKSDANPRPGSMPPVPNRLSEVRDWLNRRAEAKSQAAPLPPIEQPTSQPLHAPVHAPVATASRSSASLGGGSRYGTVQDRPSLPPDRRRFPEVGDQYGKYLLTDEVARGGTAVVFRALNRSLNSTVAVKILKMDREEGLSDDQQQMLEQLRREAQLLARFNHPNLVRVHDLEEDVPFPFLVLEYVDGLTLSDMLSHVGRLRLDCCIKIMTAVCEGLSSAQRKIGLVHRDVKPGNILLSRDGSIKLADLGLALTTDSCAVASTMSSGVIAGTAAYMAPELCTSGEIDLRTDIYSLGATFYHAVVGEMPFKGKNRMEIMLKHTREMPAPPHLRVSGLDGAVSEVILRMMAKDPNDRYQSYEELMSDLQSLQTHSASDLNITLPALASTAS
ncbi:MAG TPA: serine/threonine-protein kinase, partial [Gemmatales bacterium]|nr:serine/threonine-protein kinase [Gemmatales bacterium]